MINIRNTQRKIVLSVKDIHQDVSHILELLKYADYDLGIWFTNNKTIRLYNRRYRHIDKPTDVLSFPYYSLKAGQKIEPVSQEERNVGDLIISVEYVLQAAGLFGVSFTQRMRLILVHGILHLLGYDHLEDRDYRQMRAKEAYILKKLKQNRVYH